MTPQETELLVELQSIVDRYGLSAFEKMSRELVNQTVPRKKLDNSLRRPKEDDRSLMRWRDLIVHGPKANRDVPPELQDEQ